MEQPEVETERVERAAAALLSRGAIEVQEFGSLTVGARIRKVSQTYPAARTQGTGVIERIFHRQNSFWEQKYGHPDVELIVRNDDGTHSFLADYHVDPVMVSRG